MGSDFRSDGHLRLAGDRGLERSVLCAGTVINFNIETTSLCLQARL